jgi:parallel beta-helix repeat protein
MLESTTVVSVTGNEVKQSGQWGIALITSSSNNLVSNNEVWSSGGGFDLYWDETGTGNVWHHTECRTSSPPGLCRDD